MPYDFNEHPKTLAKDDFWGQIKRTVNGKPVSDEQITMIVNAISDGLKLSSPDVMLDLGCGNGALAKRLFEQINGYLGIDFSDYLIEIAQQYFAKTPDFSFRISDVAEYLQAEKHPERFTKALCYGAFSYLDEAKAGLTLSLLNTRFCNVSRVFIGNLPDKERAANFYRENLPDITELSNAESKIGIWRTQQEFAGLAEQQGWQCHFSTMPDAFYAGHYRYDVTLERRASR